MPGASVAARPRTQIVGLPKQFTPVSLRCSADMSAEDWAELGRMIGTIEGAVQWWLGDWWLHGEHRYGQRTVQAASIGVSASALSTAAWVCRAIEPERRRAELSFSHHREVAKLRAREQDRLLAQAVNHKWSVKQLREVIAADPVLAAADGVSSHGKVANGWDVLRKGVADLTVSLIEGLEAGEDSVKEQIALTIGGDEYVVVVSVERPARLRATG